MPRRKKNKRTKHRKVRAKKTENDKDKENSMVSTSNDVMRTCFDNDSLNKSKPTVPLELITALKTPSPQIDTKKPFEDEVSSIKATPVNKKRSVNRPVRKSNGSMNVTNLNILFDSNYVYNSPKTDSDIHVNKSNISIRRRSSSSIAKLHSPGKEKPLCVSQSTQTSKDVASPARLGLKTCNEVLETPKISKVFLVQTIHSDKQYEVPTVNNQWLKKDKTSNSEWNKKVYNGEVNINPYLNNKDIKIVNRDGSFGEISFFSPNLFQHKSSSTPIEKLQQANNMMDYLKDSLIKENVNDCSFNIEKVDVPSNRDSPLMPRLNENISFNKTPQSDKVLSKGSSKRSVKMQMLSLSKRRSCRSSPKSSNIILQTRIFNRSQNSTYSRVNISRRSSCEFMSDSLTRPTRIGMCEKVLSKLKRYTKVSHKWSVKAVELCAQLGIQLKNSLSSICNIYTDRSMLRCSQQPPVCQCEEYRRKISVLNVRIEELKEEIMAVKTQIEEQKSNKQSIDMLSQELNKVREELAQFTDLRTQVESLKEQFKCLKAASPSSHPSAPVPPPPPPLPCLPPPPPPPPPLPPILPTNTLKITRKAKSSENSDSNSRPVISLDDILKVKLKKTSDRSGVQTPTTRRNSQPIVSMDMLRQVKLRPASRPSFRPETPDSEASGPLMSPHSNLCRLLTNDGSTFRLKRLRKVGGYSFDSVYRKNALGKRERDGS